MRVWFLALEDDIFRVERSVPILTNHLPRVRRNSMVSTRVTPALPNASDVQILQKVHQDARCEPDTNPPVQCLAHFLKAWVTLVFNLKDSRVIVGPMCVIVATSLYMAGPLWLLSDTMLAGSWSIALIFRSFCSFRETPPSVTMNRLSVSSKTSGRQEMVVVRVSHSSTGMRAFLSEGSVGV